MSTTNDEACAQLQDALAEVKADRAASRLIEAIRFNVDEYMLDLVSQERFRARQDRLWNRADRAGVLGNLRAVLAPRVII